MRKTILMTLAMLGGAGAGLLLFTSQGRGLLGGARKRARQPDGGGHAAAGAEVKQAAVDALDQPQPDTAVAHASRDARDA